MAREVHLTSLITMMDFNKTKTKFDETSDDRNRIKLETKTPIANANWSKNNMAHTNENTNANANENADDNKNGNKNENKSGWASSVSVLGFRTRFP